MYVKLTSPDAQQPDDTRHERRWNETLCNNPAFSSIVSQQPQKQRQTTPPTSRTTTELPNPPTDTGDWTYRWRGRGPAGSGNLRDRWRRRDPAPRRDPYPPAAAGSGSRLWPGPVRWFSCRALAAGSRAWSSPAASSHAWSADALPRSSRPPIQR